VTSRKWLSFIISGLQWLLALAFAVALVVLVLFGALAYSSCGGRGDGP
jgi:hypothetical protein